jgi:hypothetical protein
MVELSTHQENWWKRNNTPVCCGVKGIVAAVARATEAGTFGGFHSGTSSGKAFGITTAISVLNPISRGTAAM